MRLMMRTALMIGFFASFPGLSWVVAQADLGNPWFEVGLNAGGMGILGYLLYLQITRIAPKTIETVSEKHKSGLEKVATEISGLRADIKEYTDEQNRILKQAIGIAKDQKPA